jgi:asparagine synthetase B (glutamine-hydrolysing)
MCGIAIGSLWGKPILEQEPPDMWMEMVHRGSGDDGFYLGAGVGLCTRRLSIINLAAMIRSIETLADRNERGENLDLQL